MVNFYIISILTIISLVGCRNTKNDIHPSEVSEANDSLLNENTTSIAQSAHTAPLPTKVNPDSLLILAKNDIAKGVLSIAKYNLSRLIEEFPNTPQANSAKSLLSKVDAELFKPKLGILINSSFSTVGISIEEDDWTDEKIIARIPNNTTCEIVEIKNSDLRKANTRLGSRL